MYIVIEGIDGCGKDTQADRICAALGKSTLRLNEPDDTLPTGKLLRDCLRSGAYPEAHAAMFLADRMALQATKVKPALDAGKHVVCSRSFLSTLVYQQDQWPLGWLMDIHQQMICKPTHLIVLDLDVDQALARAEKRSGHMEVYEKKDTLLRNRQRYLNLVPRLGPFVSGSAGVVDGRGTPAQVEAHILEWLK